MSTPVIGIIGGNGKMGKLFAHFFKKNGIKILISDRDTKLTNTELAQRSDIIILSVPIDKTEQIITEIKPHIRPTSALMDLTSIKSAPIKAMLKAKCEVLGMHPMFGNSNPISGQTIILCPTKKSSTHSKWIEKLFEKNGVKIIKMTPKQHDKFMSIAQNLVHFSEIVFADSLRQQKMPLKQVMECASNSSQQKINSALTLITKDPNLYANMIIENPNALSALKAHQKSVNELLKIVENKDKKAFEKYFNKNKKHFS
ncbi:prephenate dehydrogenase/arogenate dehydrogenase family protein [Candidatus Peregrinibacteria bacterium CG10_big_fil_rev_8_21_14_0_10_36_19]|nr:MAG: prephenate dehydrogenase/arogenate dehydrogenase family protein [Candidatus Peregrinibacteria bacterium CG10_big_fil_rev_8_21_14_0_10_36_19]